MSKDRTKQLLFGAVNLTLGGTDMGYIDEGGVTAKITLKQIDGKVADFGDNAINVWSEISSMEIDAIFAQTDLPNILANIWAHVTPVTNSGKTKLQGGQYAGTQLVSAAMVITPLDSVLGILVPLTLYRVVPKSAPELVYATNKVQGWKVTFRVLPDESKSNGNFLFTFGDPTITTDAVAPTVSSVVPADEASGVAVGSTVVWTMSKSIDPTTVHEGSVLLMYQPAGVGTPTALSIPLSSVVVAGTGGSTTITATPTSNLTSAKTIIAVLTTDVKDTSGNRLGGGTVAGRVGYLTNFAT